MLTLTENARTVIRRLITRVDGSKRAGLRIGPSDDTASLGVDITSEPHPGDEVVDHGGVRIFLEPGASSTLADKELDAVVEGEHVQFTLRDRMRLVP